MIHFKHQRTKLKKEYRWSFIGSRMIPSNRSVVLNHEICLFDLKYSKASSSREQSNSTPWKGQLSFWPQLLPIAFAHLT